MENDERVSSISEKRCVMVCVFIFYFLFFLKWYTFKGRQGPPVATDLLDLGYDHKNGWTTWISLWEVGMIPLGSSESFRVGDGEVPGG